jgi:hypothetical protein
VFDITLPRPRDTTDPKFVEIERELMQLLSAGKGTRSATLVHD